MVLKTAR